MEIRFEKQYNPELDCCIWLRDRYIDGAPKNVVEESLKELSEKRGVPLEQLRAIAAPSLALEAHIVENLSATEEQLRFFFPSTQEREQDADVSIGFWVLHRRGVCFRQLTGEQAEQEKRLLLHMISGIDPEAIAQVSDVAGLVSLLEEKGCTDHTLRLCLGVYLDPGRYQEAFDRILEEAAALYREKLPLLPPAEQCTFEAFRRNWEKEDDNLRMLNDSLGENAHTHFVPSPFVIYSRLSTEDNVFRAEHWILGGIWDDQFAKLMEKYDCSVPKLVMKLKAMSDQKRLEIMGSLCEGPRNVESLSKRFSMSPALLSYHLDQLLRENLVCREYNGRNNFYSLNYPGLQTLLYNLKHYLQIPDPGAAPEAGA